MDTLAARQQMVDQQIRTWEVLDPRVLDAISAVPREASVPSQYRELAFADSPLPIGFGQSMLAPKIQGRILQALGVNPADRVLEVGTGTGYLSACLSLLCSSTHSIDIHPQLTAQAASNLRAVPQARVQLETRDAFNSAPLGDYDVIAVTGSMPVYDPRFERALRLGGR
jgi:protein-L-isoaspartate(D-aspartate) O-methyltransferase